MTSIDLTRHAVTPRTPTMLDHFYNNPTTARDQLLHTLDQPSTDDYLPSALGTWGRGSHAYNCVRANAFDNLRIEADYPFSGATRLAFDLGTCTHARIQIGWHGALHDPEPCTGEVGCPYSDALIEATSDLRPEHDCSGHTDLWILGDSEAVEIKSVSDYAYGKAVGGGYRNGTPVGPELSHVVQAGIYALGLGAERVRIVYVNKGRYDKIAEWVIPFEEIEPYVVKELRVMETTQTVVQEEGHLPPRWQRDVGVIEEVPPHVSETGKWPKPAWFCGGCRWNATCAGLPSGGVPLTEVGLLPMVSA